MAAAPGATTLAAKVVPALGGVAAAAIELAAVDTHQGVAAKRGTLAAWANLSATEAAEK